MRKTHLDLLALVTRFFERRRALKRPYIIASVFAYVAWDHALGRIWAAFGLKGTWAAIAGARPAAQNLARENARSSSRPCRPDRHPGQNSMLRSLSTLK